MMGWLGTLVLILMSVSGGRDISIRWEASNTTPKIGEPFQLTLTATYPANTQIIQWFEPNPIWDDFEILSRDELVIGDGGQHQTFNVALWEVADFQTPEINIRYQIDGGQILEKSPEPLFFSVVSILENHENIALRGNTPPIQPFYIPQVVYVVGGIGLFMLGIVGYQVMRRKPKMTDDDIQLPLADVLWRNKKSDALMTSIEPLKSFVGGKLGYPVNNLTHDELLRQMAQHKLVSSQHIERLKQLLVKFDYYRFSDEKADAHIIAQFRQYTEKWIAIALDEMEQK